MQRITISLPDNIAARLEREARRRRLPVSQVAREAIEDKLGSEAAKRHIPFAGIGDSGNGTIAANMEEIMKAEWTLDRDR